MCGIYGMIGGHWTREARENALCAMGRSILHRGPDDTGLRLWDGAGIGMRRLSVLDLAGGRQPMESHSGRHVIVYNGEVYNYRELRADLIAKGVRFRTGSDTEVVVNLFEEKGPACLDWLNGMFAFAILDTQTGALFCARDRFGVKPFYYASTADEFIFGSELKSILAVPGFVPRMDWTALDLYLTCEFVPAPYSILAGVRKLEAGHWLMLEPGRGPVTKRWYHGLSFLPKRAADEGACLEELDALIDDAVRIRTVSDVALGSFLSGGVDSSLITHYLARHVGGNLKTFSISFVESSFDESAQARAVARHLGTDHHERVFSQSECLGILPQVLSGLDEPFADASVLPTAFLSRFAREFVTVALSGEGGDEFFAGYPTYYAHKLAQALPQAAAPMLARIASLVPASADNLSLHFKARKFAEGLAYRNEMRHAVWMGSFSPKTKKRLYAQGRRSQIDQNALDRLVCGHLASVETEQNWERHQAQDIRLYLADNILTKTDRASMMYSLEARSPLMDYRVAEYAARLPPGLKYRGRTSKLLLRSLAARHLPPKIASRPKKGFGIPVAHWIKGALRSELTEYCSQSFVKRQGYFDPDQVERQLKDHLSGQVDRRKELWTYYVFQKWHEHVFAHR